MIDTFNGALLLKREMMRSLRESPQVVRHGLMVVLLVGLVVGGANGALLMINGSNPERAIADVQKQIELGLQQSMLSANNDESRQLLRLFRENLEPLFAIVRAVSALPTPWPTPFGWIFQGLALFVSTPLSYLSGVLLTVAFTQLAARQLGGQGSLEQMIGLGALATAPHVLDALTFIPAVGPTLGVIAWAWGLVVLVIATEVTHKLDSGRALLAVLLYPLIFGLLALLGCCVFFVVSLAGAAGR